MQIMTDGARFSLLFRKYIDGTALPEEKLEFFALADDGKWQGQLAQLIDAELLKEDSQLQLTAAEKDEILANIYKSTASEKEPVDSETLRKIKLWPRIAVASRRKVGTSLIATAAAVAAVVFGVWFFNSRYDMNVEPGTEVTKVNDIAPGKNGATITMRNGRVIELSASKTGVVVGDDLKYNDGVAIEDGDAALHGNSELGGEWSEVLVASTTRGQTYQFTLPDGTKVWLNADSKIVFPAKFFGEERKVLLNGEAYFEVAHNAKQTFRVVSEGQVVEDIGTAFNINAYKDEVSVRTTLVEGEARVHLRGISDKPFRTLVPGQQSTLSGDGVIKIAKVDTEEAVAWKEGVFIFNSTPLDQIMRQVSRWYNVEVIYENPELKGELMGGSVSRYDKVSRILKTLENTGAVKFKITGGKVYVGK